jgi:hypothetical protein
MARMRSLRSIGLIIAVPVALAVAGGPLASAADETAKSPKQILADMARDLGKVKSYHFDGTSTDPSGRTRLAGDVTASGKADVVIRQGSATARLVLLPSAAYLRANAAYWKSGGGADGAAVAKELAGRWVKMPGSGAGGLTSLVDDMSPKRMASCVSTGTGTLDKAGTATVGGQKAIVIVDRGDRPGTTPGRMYASATGRVLPLRVTQTGKRSAGGHIDTRCEEKTDDSTASDIRLSGFDRPVRITAPRGAITIPGGGKQA